MLSYCVRPSVRPSQAGIVSKRPDEIKLIFGILQWLCYKELRLSQNVGTYLWNFVVNSGLRENFVAASRLCCQQNSSTVELVDAGSRAAELLVRLRRRPPHLRVGIGQGGYIFYAGGSLAGRRRLLPAVSPAAGHLSTPTVAALPALCKNFCPTTSKSSPI